MKRRALLTGGGLTALAAAAQVDPQQRPSRASDPLDRDRDIRLPNGKSQKDEILKADHERNVEDVRVLAKMTEELRDGIEKNDRFVLSLSTLKKLDEVEKLVKKIRGRLKRY
jgi:hypothetical protein